MPTKGELALVKAVSYELDVPVSDILSKGKLPKKAQDARAMMFLLAMNNLGYSGYKIGKRLNSNAATVLREARRIDKERQSDDFLNTFYLDTSLMLRALNQSQQELGD